MRHLIPIAVLASALVGCGSAGGSATTATATPEPSPRPSSSAAPLVSDIETPLAPGRYTHPAFTPATSIEVGEGWFGAHLYADFYDVQVDPDTPDVVAVQLARPSAIHSSVIGTDPATTAAAAAATLAGNETLEATVPEAVTVDGRAGMRMTVTARLDAETPIMEIEEGTLSILGGRRLELTLVEVDGELLTILLGGSVADWERAIELGHPVVGSVLIGD